MDCRRELIDADSYAEEELGIFAQEVSKKGVRRYFVGSYEDFAEAASHSNEHLYEVILEDRPCWLYFDLEYCKKSNPRLDAHEVMGEFRRTLASFCGDELGSPLDASCIVELDSSTDVKFSMHVVVKQPAGVAPGCPAFRNNEHAEQLVRKLVEYAERQRSAAGSRCDLFFVRGASSVDGDARVPLIDTSVYTRSRCFRVLFQSKLGKEATLKLRDGGRIVHAFDDPKQQVLKSLVSFVPAGVPLFRHDSVPLGSHHFGSGKPSSREVGQLGPLVELIEEWDAERARSSDTSGALKATSLQSWRDLSNDTFGFALCNNRYCRQKGRSHKSNGVYLVADLRRGVFRQHCFDSECRGCSEAHDIPPEVLETLPAQTRGRCARLLGCWGMPAYP